jgi:hypothetical protein
MKIGVALLGFGFCAVALIAQTPPADSPEPQTEADDNPGYVDDPGAQVLILNQLRDTVKDFQPADWKIEYLSTTQNTKDGMYCNFYRVSNIKAGAVVRICVAVGIQKSTDDAGI